jgi:hypothetical protein
MVDATAASTPSVTEIAAIADATRVAAKRAEDEALAASRAAAFWRAQEAEAEAALASKGDDADARARAALERARKERKALLAPSAATDAAGVSAADVRQAMLLHDAAAVLNLYAQAVAVTNYGASSPPSLTPNSDSCTWWRDNFLLVVGKYLPQDHV